MEAEDVVAEPPGEEGADEPADPDVTPVVLVSLDAGEGGDDGESDEAGDEEGSEEGSSAEGDHVVDVETREEGGEGGESSVEGGEGGGGVSVLPLRATVETGGEGLLLGEAEGLRAGGVVDLALEEEVGSVVAGDDLDGVDEDADDEGAEDEDADEATDASREEVNLELCAVGAYGLARLRAEQPEHRLPDQHDEGRKDEAEAVEEVLRDVHLPHHVGWSQVGIGQSWIAAVEHALVEGEHRLEPQVVEQSPQTRQCHYLKQSQRLLHQH